MTITTEELGLMIQHHDEGRAFTLSGFTKLELKAEVIARELLAARKVIDTVRPYREALYKLTGGNCDELDAELTAYNKIRYKE